MEKINYSVMRWTKEKGTSGVIGRWTGSNLEEAIIVATYEFVKEIIEIECKEKKIKNCEPWHHVDMNYASKVKCRITVLKEIDPRMEAGGGKPEIIKSFGNESIEIFQRVHFD